MELVLDSVDCWEHFCSAANWIRRRLPPSMLLSTIYMQFYKCIQIIASYSQNTKEFRKAKKLNVIAAWQVQCLLVLVLLAELLS